MGLRLIRIFSWTGLLRLSAVYIEWIGADLWPSGCRSVRVSSHCGADWCGFSLEVGAPRRVPGLEFYFFLLDREYKNA